MPVIAYKPSTSHWLFPPIIIGILIFLFAIIMIMRAVRCYKESTSFFPKFNKPFFIEGADKFKLFGTVILFVTYIFAMQFLGFLAASILIMFLYSLLYTRFDSLKAEDGGSSSVVRSVLIALANSVISSFVIWFAFSRVLRITLP
ncbi:MAG: tripartite tricarboxylate transporter TctB family protein [Treponema sp.]|nr:tripartite tricarboxylate transporter TctB family protein [Treponema sp.]